MFCMEIEWYTEPALGYNFRKSLQTILKFQPIILVLWLQKESDNRTELISLFQTQCWIKGFCVLSLWAICLVPLCPGNQDTIQEKRKRNTFNCSGTDPWNEGMTLHPWISLCSIMSLWIRIDSTSTHLKEHSCERERCREQVWDKVGSDHCCSTLSDSKGNTPWPSF